MLVYAGGGNMFQLVVRLGGLCEADARWYFQQIILAVDYCHRVVSWMKMLLAVMVP